MMDRRLVDNQYLKMDFEDDRKILKAAWYENTGNLGDEQIKDAILIFAEQILNESPLYIVTDDSVRSFTYHVAIQRWVAETITTACLQKKVQKYAIVLPKELIAALSTQQVREEATIGVTKVAYFDRMEEALKWFGD